MNRQALEHILRAASAAAGERELVVIGSQAVLGQFPNAPESLLSSIDADVYPRHAPEKSDLIDGAIGELSRFHETFGYYAHGVDDTTATLPHGWETRLVPIENANTGGAVGWCLDEHDLAAPRPPGTVDPAAERCRAPARKRYLIRPRPRVLRS